MNAGCLIAIDTPENLKKQLPIDFYELTSDSTLKSFDRLLSLDYLSQVSLFGEHIHISSTMNSNDLKNKIMEDNTLHIKSMNKIDPILEDVFIHHVITSEQTTNNKNKTHAL